MAEIIKKPNEITDNELDNVSGGTSDEKSYNENITEITELFDDVQESNVMARGK